MLLKKVVSAAVPAMIAVAAFFQAHAIGSLVDASVTPAAIAPFAEARAASLPETDRARRVTSGQAILDRNVFDSAARPAAVVATDVVDGDPQRVPICEGVRAIVTVRAEKPDASFAALDVGGKRHLRRRGGEVDDLRLVYVGDDRVWLARGETLCQAPLFAAPAPKTEAKPEPKAASTGTPFEKEIAKQIEKTGPTSYAIDRGAVSRLLEAQTELMKTPLVPEKEGYRLKSVKPGSVLASLGLESGDRLESIDNVSVTSPEGMMQAYARLSTGTLSHLTIHVNRGGRPVNLDYAIK
jgi:general secretion pathway protein C